MRGPARLRGARRTRPAARAARAARRVGPADRRRGGLRRMGRDRVVAPLHAGGALRGAVARAFRRSDGDARRGFLEPARPASRLPASRPEHRHGARPARRAADRRDLGRHDPRYGRLLGAARAARHPDRHRQRGFRDREPGRRRVPARQPVLPDPARRDRPRARRGRARAGAQHPVLARRGARTQRRAVGRRGAAARHPRRAARTGRAGGRRAGRLAGDPRGALDGRARAGRRHRREHTRQGCDQGNQGDQGRHGEIRLARGARSGPHRQGQARRRAPAGRHCPARPSTTHDTPEPSRLAPRSTG